MTNLIKPSVRKEQERRRNHKAAAIIVGAVLGAILVAVFVSVAAGVWDEQVEKQGLFVRTTEYRNAVSRNQTLEYVNQEGYLRKESDYDVRVDESVNDIMVTYTQVRRFGRDVKVRDLTVVMPSTNYMGMLEPEEI